MTHYTFEYVFTQESKETVKVSIESSFITVVEILDFLVGSFFS